MSWFRSTLASCAWIVLFALAMQMAVSFGHLHRDDLGLRPLNDAGRSPTADATANPAGDADPHHHTAPNDHCPICASTALLGTGTPPVAPLLVVPLSVVRFSPAEKPISELRPQLTLSFQARGPPVI
jgi:Protein of unknown function (DUF2946)